MKEQSLKIHLDLGDDFVFKDCSESLYQGLEIISKSAKIRGMVTHDNTCEINAIPAATDVSLPYALGITIVFNPRGIEREHTQHSARGWDSGKHAKRAMAAMGITKRRIADTA